MKFWIYWVKYNILIKLISPVPFYFFYNIGTRHFKITPVAHVIFLFNSSGLGPRGSSWGLELLLEWREPLEGFQPRSNIIWFTCVLKGSLLLPCWGQTIREVSMGKQHVKRPLHSGEDGGLDQWSRHKMVRSGQILTTLRKQSQVFPDRLGVGCEKKRSQGWIPAFGLSYWKDAICCDGERRGRSKFGEENQKFGFG